ncbi:GNAT family N-acetyltransferase [Micromonospora sp. H33]|uniref:GNAT family N-acetyltransferase n=1 Tax=Micromonospora sp. H33 TaxID=3452215 RepID=UPI003F88FED7
MPELIRPTVGLHAAWLEAHDEWGPGVHEDGFGLLPSDEVDSPAGFAAWVARLADESHPARPLDASRVHSTYRWIVEGDRVLGATALRHGPDDVVRRIGHVGYGIRPSARRRGLATWALGEMLGEARALGLDRALIVCAADNVASAKTIERRGGVLEGVRDTELGPARRYWITLRREGGGAGDGNRTRTVSLEGRRSPSRDARNACWQQGSGSRLVPARARPGYRLLARGWHAAAI